MEAVTHLERGRGAFLVAARGDQRAVQVDDQPARQHLPGDGQPREPARPGRDQRPHVRPDPGPDPGDLVQRGRIGQLQRPPHRRVARLGTQHRGVMSQHGDVVHAGRPQRDRHRHGHQRHTPVDQRELPPACQRQPQGRGQPRLIGQLPQQHRPGVPDQALTLAGHLQPVIPPRIIHDEERSCLGNDMVWLPGISPHRGALRPSGPIPPAGPRCTIAPADRSPGSPVTAPHPSGARSNPVQTNRQPENRSSKQRRSDHVPINGSTLNRGG
jgi:hypothetical protein